MHGWRERIGAGLLGLACFVGVLVGAPARARACSPLWPPPIRVERPKWSGEAKPKLVDEQIEVECDRGPRRGLLATQACRWRARYVYEGASGAAVDGWLTLPTEHELEAWRLRIDGQAVEVEPVEVEPVEFDLLEADSVDPVTGPRVELHAADAGHIEVELELELDVRTYNSDRCGWAGGFVRHLLVGIESRYVLWTVHEDDPSELPDAKTRLDVRAPRGWRISVGEQRPTWRRELTTTIDARQLRSIMLENRPVAHGPFIAAGVGFGPQVRPRLRAGYEVAAPSFLLYSFAVEGDAIEELMIIPAIEAASPSFAGIIPSAGIGVGAPVMLLPDLLPGVRTQFSLMWPVAGLIGSVDVYPRPGKPAVRGALMLQLSI